MSVDLISPLSIRPARTVPAVPARRVAADLLQLTKPTLTAMNVLVMLGAYALAGGGFDPVRLLALLGGTTLIVGSANAMNQVLEQDTDALMARTRNRPLPAGRMDAGAAATFGFVTLLASLPPLWVVDPGAAALGVGAWLAYVCVYTPMKRRSGWALLVGAVPGAVPPLMGWVAAGGALALEAWLLFAVLVAWQVPHFIGVALLSGDDYARAGIVTIVADRGDRGARVRAVAWSRARAGSTPSSRSRSGCTYVAPRAPCCARGRGGTSPVASSSRPWPTCPRSCSRWSWTPPCSEPRVARHRTKAMK